MSKLKDKRNEKGYTQSQLSELSGIKFQVIQQYETGYRNIDGAKLETLLKLAATLDCPVSNLLEDNSLVNDMELDYDRNIKQNKKRS